MYKLINKKIQFIHDEIIDINSSIEWGDDECNCRHLISGSNNRIYEYLEYHLTKNHLNRGDICCPRCCYTDLISNFDTKCPRCKTNIKIGVEIIIIWRK